MTYATKSSTLRVPGAEIYHEVKGSGPMLLIIPGGPQDAGVFADISRHLADRHPVVAYDPRRNPRSTFDGEPEELRLDVQADDAAALIAAVGGGKANVFGTSGGAQIGLNLAARYPQGVRASGARTSGHHDARRPVRRDASGGGTLPVENPSRGELLCGVADATPGDTMAALDAASVVQKEWSDSLRGSTARSSVAPTRK